MTDEEITLPPGLDLLWGLREPGRRGPRGAIGVDAIVSAAITIANDQGLEAVSMAKVARELGAATMALYRYVASKDELLQLMWDVSANGVEDVELTGETWRERMLAWALAQREAIERNIWIVQMPMATPPLAPNSLTWMERGLEALAGTGLSGPDSLRVLGLLASHALIDGRMSLDARRAADQAGEPPADYAALIGHLADADRFPRLHAAVATGGLDDRSDETDRFAEYRFDVGVILDGVQALIDR